ncbi:YiiX/YebB-like N1pC/P60 family cysteine hydrolase [Candidatus Berkiella aquae]|uniref:Permuted papain-like amidase enzyme, YaeF/YiiX, C92 family n=1 Tax=Candidatus Berkiella aquae TaxID=295108 RepID=A0A0Q9YUH3_9GAMM|nr:YiiX/YebB-like N1pC/P60 family cysteine hydrolase [Candidatus Berkiella aquae]MCS5711218.1 hypothetical protein [Candidatus Berkiella aquae]
MFRKLTQGIIKWLTDERANNEIPLCDFERIRYELRPCDVLLIEGRSRISEVIKQITQSSWSHACIYIGRLHDVDNVALRKKLEKQFNGDPNIQLVIEGYLGKGTIVSPLENYKHDHIRICRPRGLSRQDAQQVTAFAIHKLGTDYDMRQIFDLARFLVPWSILPRRWRSSLFVHHAGQSTKTVCSTMIAEAFACIDFPILPVIKQHEESGVELYARNPRLFTPRDFDYSPYFEIIKYPFVSFLESPYRHLPWNRQGLMSQDGVNIIDPMMDMDKPKKKRKLRLKNKNVSTIVENPEIEQEMQAELKALDQQSILIETSPESRTTKTTLFSMILHRFSIG